MNDPRDQLQRTLGEAYTIERELGGGGMSRVFLAEERALGRQVVIKVLPPDLGAGLSIERFRREIQLAAKLQHPHIVPLLAAGEAGQLPFFTMPFVEGSSLRDLLSRGETLPLRESVRVLRDVASALAYAHERGVVHRDIKPDNVLLSGGSAMVTDFGVAKALSSARQPEAAPGGTLTVIGTSLGTPAYMAPEQAAADPSADHRADLYSFGIMAYELLTGGQPFQGRSPQALLAAQMIEVPPLVTARRPEVPDALAELVRRCLEKDPAERPQSATDVVRELDDIASGTGVATAVHRATPASDAGAAPIALAAPGRKPSRAMWYAVAALVVVVGGVAIVMTRGRVGTAGANAQAPAAATPKSVAVLPLVNVGGDAKNEYFSDGMTDELTSALNKVPGLRVASRTSAFAFKNKSVTAREIAKELNVGTLLEGTVRRDGPRLRVSAQLTNAVDGLSLWSESYEREMKDVFSVQDDITKAIVGAMQVALVGGASAASAPHRGTDDLQAYDLYLRGRFFWHQRGAESLRKAAGYFQQAIAKDPAYAQAYAGLADAMGLLPIYGDTPPDSAVPIAQRAAERALALDSTLGEAHTTLGLLRKSSGDWAGAERAFRRAIALSPGYATAHQWYSELLIITGRVAEAATEMQRAQQLDPLSAVVAAELAYTLALAGRYDAAIAQGQRAVELDSSVWISHAFLGYAYLFAKRDADAVRELESAVRLDRNILPLTGSLAYAYGHSARREQTQRLLQTIEARAGTPSGSPIAVSLAYLGVDDRDRALTWLERAADRRDPWLFAMSLNPPWYDGLRADPRFAEVARKMGLDVARMTSSDGGRSR